MNGEKRHYTTIKGISRILSKLNRKIRRAYHFCINYLNGFRTGSARDKHCEYCSSNGPLKKKLVKISRWTVSVYASLYGDIPDPLKMYRGKDWVEKFVECMEVKWLYKTFPRQPMTGLSDTLKREHRAAEKCHICLKEFNDPSNRKVRDQCHYIGLYRGAAHNNCELK